MIVAAVIVTRVAPTNAAWIWKDFAVAMETHPVAAPIFVSAIPFTFSMAMKVDIALLQRHRQRHHARQVENHAREINTVAAGIV